MGKDGFCSDCMKHFNHWDDYLRHRCTAITCPECGFYCLGKGGKFCVDKPALLRQATDHGATLDEEVELLTAPPKDEADR